MRSFFSINQEGSFQHLETFLAKMAKDDLYQSLETYAIRGMDALASATPERTGLTAASWSYTIVRGGDTSSITWTNSHMDDNGGAPVVILLQYGHGTGTGGYVQGHDFINPAISGIMDDLADEVWKAVVQA